MLAVVADTLAGRTDRWLDQLAATGALPAHHRVAVAADEARTSLDQLLRTVELAGHDPARVLADAVTAGSLDKATSVAQVLHFRIRTAYDGPARTPASPGMPTCCPATSTRPPGPRSRTSPTAADARRAELGAQLADCPAALGPRSTRPASPTPRMIRPGGRSGSSGPGGPAPTASWSGTPTTPTRSAPPHPPGSPEKHALFRAAHTALDLPDVGADEEDMSEGRLRARVAAWEREQRAAPRYVADELEATHDALRKARTDATVWAARADTHPDPLEADQLRAAAHEAAERAEQLAAAVRDLEFADDVRALWRADTAVTRDHAERARVAAGLKGINLDNPADRVTAQEWLDAHLVAQLAAEHDRDITDTDLAPDDPALHPPAIDAQRRADDAADDRARRGCRGATRCRRRRPRRRARPRRSTHAAPRTR